MSLLSALASPITAPYHYVDNGLNSLLGAPATAGSVTSAANYNNPPAPVAQVPSKAQNNPPADPTSGQTGTVLGDSTTSQYSPEDLAAYNLYTGQAQDALSRASAAYSAQQANVASSYGQQQNALNSSNAAATNQYQTGVTGNQQSKLTNDNAVNQQANASYQSILRILGGLGASGGSEAQYLVPQLVNQNTSAQLSAAGQTYAQNARTLDQNYGDYQNQEKNQQAQLNDWKTGQLATDQADYTQTQQNLLGILAGLQSKSAAPSDLASSLNSVVGTIPNDVAQNPTYTGTTPVYNAPTLGSFEAANAPVAQVAPTAAGSSATPYLSVLAGPQKKQQTA